MTRAPHNPPPRRVLVTGGAGFIGSHLVERLLARGDRVTVVDNLSTGRRENLPDAHPGLRFVQSSVSEALRGFRDDDRFDEVYHLAAAVGVRLVIAQPIRSIETNVEETAALLRFVLAHAAPPRTLIASSSEVYGKSSKTPFSEDDDALYGPTTVGRWSYACSKAIDEYLALAYHAQHGVPAVIARFFNTDGPRQVGDYGMVLPRFVHAALAGQPLTIYGDGSASRCFCDVRDVADVLPRMLASEACAGRVFNVGSDRPITIAALADLVTRTLGSRSPKRFLPYAEAFGPGFEDLRQRQPDLSRLRSAVAFEPRRPLEQTIRDVADALRTAPAGAGAAP
jgi:UDP-glucose 4-epimerase